METLSSRLQFHARVVEQDGHINAARYMDYAADELTHVVAFLRRLAVHLNENDMPGQAGNCTLVADRIEEKLGA